MKTVVRSQTSLGVRLVLAAMVLYSILSLGRAVAKQVGAEGGFDFHLYWYYGHHVRQGNNPYRAFFDRQEPGVPVSYVGGVIEEELDAPAAPFLRAPANTAALILPLSALSFLSWPLAKWVWFLINLAITLLTPWLIIRLLPRGVLSTAHAWFIHLSYYVLSATRIAVWMGQTTLVVFVCMLGALLTMELNWLVSGVLLGLALSKYSVALPALLFVLLRRKYRIMAVAAMVQALGIVIIASLGGDSPLSVLGQYGRMFSVYVALPQQVCQQCIHLANFFQGSRVAYAVTYAGVSVIWAALWVWSSKSLQSSTQHLSFSGFHLFTILVLCSLLAVYHHSYDAGIGIVFVGLLVCGLVGNLWDLSEPQRRGLWVFLAAFMVAINLPGEIAGVFLPEPWMATWMRIVNGAMSAAFLAALVISLWLVRSSNSYGSRPGETLSVTRTEVD